MDAEGKHNNQLADHGSSPWWFPDGNRLGFLSEGGYWSVGVDGVKKKLFDLDMSVARLSPDGKRVVFHSSRGGSRNLWLVSIEGGEPTQLTFDTEAAGFPAWSPNGSWIAFQINRSDGSHICVIPSAGGAPAQLTFDQGPQFLYDWSPDNDRIVFAGQRDGV